MHSFGMQTVKVNNSVVINDYLPVSKMH